MPRAKLNLVNFHAADVSGKALVAILFTGCLPALLLAQQPSQKTFTSPEEASQALFMAAQNSDQKVLLDIFGPDGKEIVSSGDAAEDAENRAKFAQKYEEMHRLVKEPDGTVTLYIGAKNWPTPIPLVEKGNLWYFETEAGKKEILARRIGRNEMSAIRVCQELVAAEKKYRSTAKGEYAQKMISDEGKHNGLYWKAADGEPQSPVGPLVAAAAIEGDGSGAGAAPAPYRGYYFRMLLRQGKNVSGGTKSYVVNGKLTEGFAFVAFPAEYRSSGVMTFMVNEDGVVYERDLGKKTEVLAKAMKEYNPNSAWQKSVEEPEQTAGVQKTK